MTSGSPAAMGLQNHEIFPNLLGFKVLVGCGLKLKSIVLKVLERGLEDKRFKCSINCLKTILNKSMSI